MSESERKSAFASAHLFVLKKAKGERHQLRRRKHLTPDPGFIIQIHVQGEKQLLPLSSGTQDRHGTPSA